MQYSFNNSRKIPKLAQFIPGIYNNFYYKILGYFWGVTVCPQTITINFLGHFSINSFFKSDQHLGLSIISVVTSTLIKLHFHNFENFQFK